MLIENYQQPNFEIKNSFSKGGRIVQDFTAIFFLFELNVESYELIEQLQNSIYGWCPLIEFYDGTFKYYNTPLICREGEIKPHKEMAFEIKMENVIPTTKSYYDYTPGVSLIPVYRFDTELISWDNEIYSWDYEL